MRDDVIRYAHVHAVVFRSGTSLRAVALLAAIACGDPGPVDQIRFAEPERVQAARGADLAALAAAHDVTLEELRAWNGLEGDRIGEEVVLLVWRQPEIEPVVAVVEEPAPATRRKTPSRARSAPQAPQLVITEAAVVVGESASEGSPAPRIPVEPPSSVRSAGVLAALGTVDEQGADLSESVAALEVRGKAPGTAGLAQRADDALADRGSAEELTDLGRAPRTQLGPEIGEAPIRPPSLPMPAAKACLAPPKAEQLKADDGYLANASLTPAQIGAAMTRFVPKTMPCIPAGTKGSYEVETQLKVGCDGRVRDVWIIDTGALPDNVGECIAKTLRYASFPAHAMPDGVVFAYPIVYRY